MIIAYLAIKGMPIGGGIEKLTEEIGSRMVRKGHDVTVYSSRDYGNKTDGYFKGMKLKTVPSINTKTLHKLSICFHATLNVIKNAPDIVHVHAVGPSVFSIIPRVKGIPTVVQTHGFEWKRDKWGKIGKTFFKIADYSALYFPHKTTSVSKIQKDYYLKKFGKDVAYIPTGVNHVEKSAPDWILKQGLLPGKYILFAARLVEEKGAHFLIEAFRQIDTGHKLVVAGDAAHAEKYKHFLKEKAGDDSRILFPGFITGEPLAELFSNAYLFCLPSTLEGLPIALLEAMSYGNCCVASDIPENLEAIEHNGFTFKNRNVQDLRHVLEYLLIHPEEVDAIKTSAQSHVLNNYTWDSIADQMENLYYSIL